VSAGAQRAREWAAAAVLAPNDGRGRDCHGDARNGLLAEKLHRVVALVRAYQRLARDEVRVAAVAAAQRLEPPEELVAARAREPRLAVVGRHVGRREVRGRAGVAHAVDGAHEARRARHALRDVAQLPLLAPRALRAARARDARVGHGGAVEPRRAQQRDGHVVVLAVGARRARVAHGRLDRRRVGAREAVGRLQRAGLLRELPARRRHGHGRARGAHEARGAQARAHGRGAGRLAVEAGRAELRVTGRRGPHLVEARARHAVGARLARVGPQRRVVSERVRGAAEGRGKLSKAREDCQR
jgi:hypothetical protein